MQQSQKPSSHEQRKDVKVKIIVTKMVHTDPTDFKSVVQRLTGKESTAAEVVESPAVSERNADEVEHRGGRESREFEDMLMKLPSLDELKQLWDD
uniref:Uncharacterized protein LOC109505663 n=1 Tax=Elaeis guineensis var. tenera TaxID=51953 RepID=A0A6J0PG43_ELAGV|nr:uncharacterized protein LOC109505663 [Elaeis guineensis]